MRRCCLHDHGQFCVNSGHCTKTEMWAFGACLHESDGDGKESDITHTEGSREHHLKKCCLQIRTATFKFN